MQKEAHERFGLPREKVRTEIKVKKMKAKALMPRSKFLEVECKKCKEKTIVFDKAATVVNCEKCGQELVVPTGGHAIILGKILRVLE